MFLSALKMGTLFGIDPIYVMKDFVLEENKLFDVPNFNHVGSIKIRFLNTREVHFS